MYKKLWILIILFLVAFTAKTQESVCVPVGLKCEYLENPIGIDIKNPRLMWMMDDSRSGAKQKAYRIVVGTNRTEVNFGKGNIWDSGKITSNKSLVTYKGKTLEPYIQYFWAVQLWDKNGIASRQSETASFETGKMVMKNWIGSWITDQRDVDLKPAPYFRKEFDTSKEVEKARAYITAAGIFELYVNGDKVGDNMLDPTYTRFDRRNLYVSHDVTDMLKDKNAIGVVLGNGWYNHQSTNVWYFHKAPWRYRPKFCLDLRITYKDGTIEIIYTDRDWKTSLGPIVFNSIYTAEHFDARLDHEGWTNYGFDDSDWKNSVLTAIPSQNIVSQVLHPVRVTTDIIPVNMRKFNDTCYVFDLGRNISGISELTLSGEVGTEIRVIHSELLDTRGHTDLSNIIVHYRPTDDTDPFQTDVYILSGNGEETFSPKFNYKGFQFVEVISSKPIELTQNSLKGKFMHSDVPPVGQIHSSSDLLNKIWYATNNSYLSNLFGYPTDCPQREKNGWTGDAHIAIETGLYNFDGITIYEKWLADHRDVQQPNGVLSSIIPSSDWGYAWGNGPDWTSTIAIIPWNIYLFYGDNKLLYDSYDHIKRYVDRISHVSPEYICYWGLGDWVPVKSKTPKEFTSTIYYYVDALILAKTAKNFGYEADYTKYSDLAENIKNAFNKKWFNQETGIYGSGFQTELSTSLYWGLVSDGYVQKVADNLAKKVIADNRHIDVGLLGSKAILNALSENGYSDLAYQVASQEDFPSWGVWIKDGATTLFEDWKVDEKRRGAMSRNHIMFGEISAWYYKALGGIKPDPENPGFKNILLEPHFVSGLEYFDAKYIGPYGEIVSSWKKEDGKIKYDVVIPPNSSARLTIHAKSLESAENEIMNVKPDRESFVLNLEAGKYNFIIEK